MTEVKTQHDRSGGFTLTESLLASVILAMVITAITTPFTAAARNEQADGRRTVAAFLAGALMEEIISKPFADPDGLSSPGPEVGESARADFDNIDDYHGYAEAAGEILDGRGQPAGDLLAYDLTRHVTTTYVYVDGQDVSDPANFIRIEVEVRRDGQALATLTRLAYGM